MRLIRLAPLVVAVSRAGGLGFLAAGTDLSALNDHLKEYIELVSESPIRGTPPGVIPVGVGFINWAVDTDVAIEAIKKFVRAAVWFFAPRENSDLVE